MHGVEQTQQAVHRKIAKRLTWILWLLGSLLAFPSTTIALDFGRLKVYSALDQQMDVEVELLDASPNDLATLDVSIEAETFDGPDWTGPFRTVLDQTEPTGRNCGDFGSSLCLINVI